MLRTRPDRLFARLGLAVCTLVAASAVVSAAPPAALAQSSDEEKAKRHFGAGAEHFFREEYSLAVVEFMKAYEYKKDPMILYNLSLAHARMGNLDRAMTFGERARRLHADRGGMSEQALVRVDARLAAWRVALGAGEAAEASAAPVAATLGPAATEVPAVPATSGGDGFGWMGWTGVALMGAGAGLGAWAYVIDQDMEAELDVLIDDGYNGRIAEYERRKAELEDQQVVGLAALYSGVALGVTGLTMIVWDAVDDGGDEVQVRLSPRPDGAGVRLRVDFE